MPIICDISALPTQFADGPKFKTPIGNAELYSFLDSLGGMEERMFEPEHFDWNGVDVQFIVGGVCEENWEETIGEKPTKFFPGDR